MLKAISLVWRHKEREQLPVIGVDAGETEEEQGREQLHGIEEHSLGGDTWKHSMHEGQRQASFHQRIHPHGPVR